eukprot:8512436-Ditylum_brightwellii.AAC.1
MASIGHCWQQQQELTSSAPIEKDVGKKARVGSNSKKLAAATTAASTKSKTAAMAMANQDGDTKPVKTGMGSRQEGACHTRSLW